MSQDSNDISMGKAIAWLLLYLVALVMVSIIMYALGKVHGYSNAMDYQFDKDRETLSMRRDLTGEKEGIRQPESRWAPVEIELKDPTKVSEKPS